MDELHELRETLCRELKEYGAKRKMDAATLDVVDKLAHALKNLDRVIGDETGYSGYMDNGWHVTRDYSRPYSMRMGRGYSRSDSMADRLRDMMADSPDEATREELRRLADRLNR